MEEYSKRNFIRKAVGGSNYFFNTCMKMVIDATAIGNHTRFVNHNCGDLVNCRVEVAVIDRLPRNFFISKRGIKKGEQILLNYGRQYFSKLECMCGSINCISRK